MSLATLIVKLLQQLGAGMAGEMAGEPVREIAADKQQASSRAIQVTPARRPVWPSCCG